MLFNFVPLAIFETSAAYLAESGQYNPVLTRYNKPREEAIEPVRREAWASTSGFPSAVSFFGTMRVKLWDTLAALESLMPIHDEFYRMAFSERNLGRILDAEDFKACVGVVKAWLFRGCLQGLLTHDEYSTLTELAGSR